MTPTMVENLYTLTGLHTSIAQSSPSYSTVGQVQVHTEQSILPLENEKGSMIDVKA